MTEIFEVSHIYLIYCYTRKNEIFSFLEKSSS